MLAQMLAGGKQTGQQFQIGHRSPLLQPGKNVVKWDFMDRDVLTVVAAPRSLTMQTFGQKQRDRFIGQTGR